MRSTSAIHLIVFFLGILSYYSANAQCVPVTDTTGILHNTAMNDSVSFNVTFSPTCQFINLGAFTGVCGLTFPGVQAPWSGNTNGSTSTITYAFSKAITSIDILIGYTGVNGIMAPETFELTTNSSIPSVFVNSGNCIPWTINGNITTSPAINGGLNSIHTITSTTPFDSLTITTNSSGSGPGANGGSSFALCDGSILTGFSTMDPGSIASVSPNPSNGHFLLSSKNNTPFNRSDLISIYNSKGALVKRITPYGNSHQISINLASESSGLYYISLMRSDKNYSYKVLKTSWHY